MKKYFFINFVIIFLLFYFSTLSIAQCVNLNDRISYIPDGYYKISNKLSGKAIEVRDSFFSPSADVIINDFVNDNNQIFYLKALSDKSYSISPAHSNLFLGVNPENERINQDKWKDEDYQKFFLEIDYETGLFKIISKKTSKALTVDNILTGTLVYGEREVNIDYQLWSFEKEIKNNLNYNYFEDGFYKIENTNSNKVFEVSKFNFGTSDIIENAWSGENNQIFYIERQNDGSYSIKAAHSNMYLSIDEDKLIVKPWNDEECQKFNINNYSANKYIIKSKLLDINIGVTSNEDVSVKEEKKNDDFLYFLTEVFKNPRLYPEKGFVDNGYYRISNYSSSKNLEIKDFSLDNGSILTESDLKNVNNQIFYFEHLGENKYAIKVAHTMKVLQVTENGDASINQWDFLNMDNQKFYVEPYGDGFILRSCSTKKLVTILDDKILQHDENSESAQMFKIIAANRNEYNTANGEAPPPPTPVVSPPKTVSYILDVPLINQRPELPTGCEITAVTMMLLYSGAKVNKVALANEMPKSSNPNSGYVGNPFLRSGWTIYPPALLPLVKKYTGTCIDLTGCTKEMLEEQIRKNKPVVVWASGMYGFSVHALTLTGYDETNYYFNDPWANKKNMPIKKNVFVSKWARQSKRALSY